MFTLPVFFLILLFGDGDTLHFNSEARNGLLVAISGKMVTL